jgi:hypothetical protein
MMKLNLFPLILVVSMIISCNNVKENKNEPAPVKQENETGKTVTPGSDNTIEFYLNGDEEKITERADISLDEIKGKKMLSLANNSMGSKSKNMIVFDIKDVATGSYSFDGKEKMGQPSASFMPDYTQVNNTYKFNIGQLVITSIDLEAGIVNATFEGAAKNAKGDLISISKGKITNGKIHKRITGN